MSTKIQNMVKQYGYPDVVFEVISKFLEIVSDVFENDDVGVLLVGSTSRGELCWQETNENIILFSDIEFIIAVHSESVYQKKELEVKVNKL